MTVMEVTKYYIIYINIWELSLLVIVYCFKPNAMHDHSISNNIVSTRVIQKVLLCT